MNLRPATSDDLDIITSLTRAHRRQLAKWSPVYFNPRSAADENHAAFLAFLVGSDQHTTSVLIDDERVVGFYVVVDQGTNQWVDDLSLSEPQLWKNAIQTLSSQVGPPWVTCISASDTDRIHGLRAAGTVRLSTYFSIVLDSGQISNEVVPQANAASLLPTDYVPAGPQHTFGGSPFSPQTPGALVVVDEVRGYVIGSPSAEPPIYDPGGPTCVVDQIIGPNQRQLIQQAIRQAGRRGDAQMIVVCAEADQELESVLLDLDFKAEVHLLGIN